MHRTSPYVFTAVFLGTLLSPGMLLGQFQTKTPVIDTVYHFIGLYEFMEVVSADPQILHPDDLPAELPWRVVPTPTPSLSPDSVWWYRCTVESVMPDSVDYILKGAGIGYVDFFLFDTTGTEHSHHKVGLYRKASEKPLNRTNYSHAPVRLGPGRYIIYIRAQSIDHQPIYTNWNLESPVSWYSRPAHRLDPQIQFFQGVFWILIIYNLVLFFSLRIPSYFYYAAYLICVSAFVSFSVGSMTYPGFGDPRWLAPLGYLFFGSINIFYYLFGKDFLTLHQLLPKWDRFISVYLIVKLAVLVLMQINLFIWFHIPIAIMVEFSMVALDVVISILFYIALLRTKKQLAYFFVAGSSAVIVFGITSAIIGYLFEVPYTFTIFLGSIVVEVIFFSLGLGYKIRLSEKKKLEAERQRRIAQEALNEELTRINTAFGRFVPQDFLRSLGRESILDVELGDSVEEIVTVMFADIRGYTTLSESMTPQENFHFLNDYLGRMGPIIHEHNGFVNQYYGDGIMALFMGGADDAVQAAVKMQQELLLFNQERKLHRKMPVQTGIGVHTGPLMMGVIGDTLRLEAGVVADTVNIAARVEGLTKQYGAKIVISGNTEAGLVGEDLIRRSLGLVRVKGRESGLAIFEVLNGADMEESSRKAASLSEYELAVSLYTSGEFAGAEEAFSLLTRKDPEDQAVQVFLTRTRTYLANGSPEGWDGVDRLEQK